MVEPVVSSRFGKRPLLEVPAMQVSSYGSVEVPSLQPPFVHYADSNPFPSARNTIQGPNIYNTQPAFYSSGGLQQGSMVPRHDRKHYSAPNGPLYNQHGSQYFYGPNGETVFLAPVYNPHNIYPGVVNPPSNYVNIHPQGAVRAPFHSFGMLSPGFNITCELEYGRVMSIDVRDSHGEFRGIPEFLRTELLRTYGAYPYTEVKIKLEGSEFHIFATHDNRRKHRRRIHRDSDSDSDSDRHYDRCAQFPDWNSEVESYTNGVRPRNPEDKPRGIIRERGWNRYR